MDRGEPTQDADLACAAPEILSPTPRADGRSAVYGLGALLYRCVGGMPPFRAADRDALKAKILKESPRDLKKLNIRASDVLCEIVSNLPLSPDSPTTGRCDGCGACVAACPTGAVSEAGLDARRCPSPPRSATRPPPNSHRI